MAARARGSREAGGAGRGGARALMAAGPPLTAGPGGHGAHQHPQGNPARSPLPSLPTAAASAPRQGTALAPPGLREGGTARGAQVLVAPARCGEGVSVRG